MGPRLFSRGKRRTAIQSIPGASLQWGRDCSAAERGLHCSPRPKIPTSFNGAATVQPRKGRACRRGESGDRRASMGPRLFSRGKRPVIVPSNARAPGFNGAATVQPRKVGPIRPRSPPTGELQWGRDCSAAESPSESRSGQPPTSFNGAATVQPRKAAGGAGHPGGSAELQWGRDCSAAERHVRSGGFGRAIIASMGPRLFSRGKANPSGM